MFELVTLLSGLALLLAGAESLVRGARSLGLRTGLSPLVVGLTVVAYGTSAPELVVSTAASVQGQDGIALANVVGSNICNILLILGVCGVIQPLAVHTRILRVEAPLLAVVSAAVAALVLSGEVGRVAGGFLVLGLVAYTVWTLRLSRAESAEVVAEIGEAQPAASQSIWIDVALIVAGLALLFGGASLFVRGAVAGAESLGVPAAVVGLSVVAVGTSLPELATSVVASLRGQGDMAIGNVVGSNVFNLTGVLGTAAVVDPIGQGGVERLDLVAMVASALLLLGFLYSGRRLSRWEGAVLLSGYALYLTSLTR